MKRRKRDLDEAVPRPPAELIDELAIHIADGRNVLFITGAGLSVSAGIPAFRSGAGAVWEENVVQYGTRKSLRKDPVEWHNAFWQVPVFLKSLGFCGGFTSSKRVVSRRAGRGWFLFRF